MGFWDDLTGKTAANAAKAAAADTYKKQQQAIAELKGYGDEYAGQFQGLAKGYDPYVQGGLQGEKQLLALLGLDGDQGQALEAFRAANPGLNEGLATGSRAITGNAAAKGMLNSGSTLKGLNRFGQDYSNKFFSDHLARLMGIGQQGMGATSAQNATVGEGLRGQLGTRTSAYGGAMNAAGTTGQGDIAAANARAAGTQNLFNTGANLLGKFIGVGGFGGGGGGGMDVSAYTPKGSFTPWGF